MRQPGACLSGHTQTEHKFAGRRAEPGKHERLNDQKETNRHDNIKDNTRKSHLRDIDMEDKGEEGIPQSYIQAEIKGSGEVPYPGRRYFRNGILP